MPEHSVQMQRRDLTLKKGLTRQDRGVSTVLVVDDEPNVRDVVARYLRRDGHRTIEAGDGEVAKRLIEEEEPASLIVLDVMLPGIDGLELCRWIRDRSDTPVILLTALGEETDRIVGLELGADDYVTKPFSPRELAVRVRNILRRSVPAAVGDTRYRVGDIELDASTREVWNNGSLLKLTLKEFELLHTLISRPRRVFAREELMDRVWGYRSALETGTLTVHIRRLREKLEDDPSRPRHLETVWGVGYRFVP
jgi:DNA-binding response OmpR family regulator